MRPILNGGQSRLVVHETHGIGKIVGEWGPFWTCRNCCVEFKGKIRLEKSQFRKVRETIAAAITCAECHATERPLQVDGSGIFDVRFEDGKLRCIYRTALKFLPNKKLSAVDRMKLELVRMGLVCELSEKGEKILVRPNSTKPNEHTTDWYLIRSVMKAWTTRELERLR